MADYYRAAFFEICDEAIHADDQRCHVSLYRSEPYYGGPEEGGWWGEDTFLVATQSFPLRSAAEDAKTRMQEKIEEWNKEAKRAYGERCRAECDWLEERGLDDNFLPEPDGETRFWIAIEDRAGQFEQRGSRHYE